MTPLLWAVREGRKETVQYLVEECDLRTESDNNRMTPLMWATQELVSVSEELVYYRMELLLTVSFLVSWFSLCMSEECNNNNNDAVKKQKKAAADCWVARLKPQESGPLVDWLMGQCDEGSLHSALMAAGWENAADHYKYGKKHGWW
eukprot:TRINITY_DN67614_c2_g1_i3.p1 TRINITY_DN67614_c2_g1~~TRINITY_DN67614_c2_g1_i3.p1  ORF type:complete len:147 (-),score=24.07 TRINITY_DN67614_c2_g1_i3:76-516(-)